ncbi:MAG TPA: DUF3419 family protein [Thermoanaerobaculia bacterium]|nr:DUF3419 family protein [Thermoanaerobaculia bacterium]
MNPDRPAPAPAHGDPAPSADRIADRARFDFVRYANCWEDADVLVAALRPRPGARILGIASAGDNCLSLVAEGADVVAVDLSPAQLALAELKRAAIRRLPYAALLGFLGVRPAVPERDRLATLAELGGELSPGARDYWRRNAAAVAGGVVHWGKFEHYFGLFRRRVLPLVHGRRTVGELLAPRDAAGRADFYRRRWDTWRWRLLFRLFFSRAAMGRLGRDPEFFRYVEGSVAERILGRARYALTALPIADNPYVRYILTGGFETALPHYLRPEVWARLRARLDSRPEALALHLGAIDEVGAAIVAGGGGRFDGFNLSDIFEYLDPPACARIFRGLLAAANPGARLAYWNMLVPRRCPPPEPAAASPGAATAPRVRPLDEEAAALFARDRAFFYSAFVLEEVC